MYVSIVKALISPAVKKLFTFVEPVISQTWLPELLTPQNTHKQPLELSAHRESKLSMTLQSFLNLASTCPCRLSSHRDPHGTPISCQSQLPPVFPFSETFLMLFPTPPTFLLMQYHSLVPTNVPSSENSSLSPLRPCAGWEPRGALPFAVSPFPECGATHK